MSVTYQPYQPPTTVEEPATTPQPFEVGRAFHEARATFRAHAVPLTLTCVLADTLGYLFSDGTSGALAPIVGETRATYASYTIGFVVSTFLSIGTTRIMLDVARGKPFRLNTLFSGGDVLVVTLLASLVTTIAIACGFLFLIVPGFFLQLGFAFVPILIADRRIGVLRACRESLELTRGRKWRLFVLCMVSGLVLLCGLLALIVGVLPAIAFIQLFLVHAYLQATGER
jgi:hypothetical protein